MGVKVIEHGEAAVEKFIRGIKVVDQMVGDTLGPAGRNRIIARKYRSPIVTNDGVTVARNIVLDDEMEDMAAQVLVEIAMKTNETVGDGTTTSVVAGAGLALGTFERLKKDNEFSAMNGGNISPITYAKEIWKQLPVALELLSSQRIEVEGDLLDKVIATSLENLEYGKILGDVFRQIGPDGYISTEDNWGTKYGIDTEVITGMRFLGTYASAYLANGKNKKEACWEDALVLVTNERIDSMRTFKSVFEEMKKADKKKLVVIGGYSENTNPFSTEVISNISRAIQAAAAGGVPKPDGSVMEVFEVLLVKAPTLRSEELQDVAVFCDAHFFDAKLKDSIRNCKFDQFGSVRKIVVNEDDVNIIGGRGNTAERIELLKKQMDDEKDPMFAEKTKRRIASLAAGMAIIRVGAPTEQERTYLKYKLEDAVNAAKAAMEEGVVPGAGIALKNVADELGEDNILYPALIAPYERIRANAGVEDMEVPDTIVDPHKVVRLALTNACSAAAALISADGGISDRRETLFDSFANKMTKMNVVKDDFRDDENQDLGRGRGL